MTTPDKANPGPEPSVTPGLEPGGGVPPGETPPDADQLSGAAPIREDTPNQGPVAGNRTPMVVTLVALALIVVAVAVVIGASFIAS